MSAVDLAVLVAGLLFAGLAKGATAMGLPLIATPILAGITSPQLAVVVMAIPMLVSNTLLIGQDLGRLGRLSGLWGLMLCGAVGTAIGSRLLASLDQRTFAILISVMVGVILTRGERILGPDPAAGRGRLIGPLIAFGGGLLQGTTSIAGPLLGAYVHALRLPPRDFVVSLALLFEANAATQVVSYGFAGLYTPEALTLGVLGLVPTLAGLAIGSVFRNRIDPVRFRGLVTVLIVASALNLVRSTFFA